MTARRHVVVVLPPKEGFAPTSSGAIGLVVRDVARATAGEWDTTVIGREAGGEPFPGPAFIESPGSAFWRATLGLNRAYLFGLRRALRAAAPDIIEVHNRIPLALDVARAAAGVPTMLVLHNDPQEMRAARTPAERSSLLQRLAGVIGVSEWVRDRMIEGVEDPALRRKAHAIPNGLDLALAPQAPAERDRLILFVGRITANKGFDSFVRACALALPRLPGWRAEAIGADRFRADSPDTKFIRAVRPEAEAAGVRMLGFQDNTRTLAAMSRAAVVVMPSRWAEPLGRVAQEAQLAGAPLITTRRGGLPEAAGEAALYVDPEKPEEIAEAIERIARDAALAARLREAGAHQVRRFGLPETQARWSALRRSLLG